MGALDIDNSLKTWTNHRNFKKLEEDAKEHCAKSTFLLEMINKSKDGGQLESTFIYASLYYHKLSNGHLLKGTQNNSVAMKTCAVFCLLSMSVMRQL